MGLGEQQGREQSGHWGVIFPIANHFSFYGVPWEARARNCTDRISEERAPVIGSRHRRLSNWRRLSDPR